MRQSYLRIIGYAYINNIINKAGFDGTQESLRMKLTLSRMMMVTTIHGKHMNPITRVPLSQQTFNLITPSFKIGCYLEKVSSCSQ